MKLGAILTGQRRADAAARNADRHAADCEGSDRRRDSILMQRFNLMPSS